MVNLFASRLHRVTQHTFIAIPADGQECNTMEGPVIS